MSRTDQSLGHYDASVRAHINRRFHPGRPFRRIFERMRAAAASGGTMGWAAANSSPCYG
jgi:hypothetical protein